MILCIVGDVDPDEVIALADEILGTEKKPVGKKLRCWQEEMKAQNEQCHSVMEVAMPAFQMSFKAEPAPKGTETIRAEVVGDLAAEVLFGESSQLYLKLYEEGSIDSSFGGGYESIDGCAMLNCGGDSYHAEQIRTAVLERAEQLVAEGITDGDFLRMKRSAMGRRIRDLDSFDSTCFRICAYHFGDFEYFEFPAIYADVHREEVLEFIQRVVTKERCALSIIDPKEET